MGAGVAGKPAFAALAYTHMRSKIVHRPSVRVNLFLRIHGLREEFALRPKGPSRTALYWPRGCGIVEHMDLFGQPDAATLDILRRVDAKYLLVFEAAESPADRIALAKYFLPHRSSKPVVGVTRPRVLKWYCPFADQRSFPTGHRYCINVYTGCEHQCAYCYAAGYEPDSPNCKRDFEKKLARDLADLDAFDVPPAPVHLSNSTDAFQPIEEELGHTRIALEYILRSRHRFSSVVILTKNPAMAARPEYVSLLQRINELPVSHRRHDEFATAGLPGLRVEVSLAFWRDEISAVFDPGAPSVSQRCSAIGALRAAGIPVVLRIDPLLPRDPLPHGKCLADFGLPNAQRMDDLEALVHFAAEQGVMHIVYSTARIVQPRFKPMVPTMQKLKQAYEHIAAPKRLTFRGGSHRLPDELLQEQIVAPFLDLCRCYNVRAVFCKTNLLDTP